MTRQEFIARLKQGLAGVPEPTRSELIADYEAHFEEAKAAGRSEEDVAAALGDPERLARELQAEARVKRWQAERNPEAAVAAVFAVLGLGALDVLILLPILVTVVSVLFACFIAAAVALVAGAFVFVIGPFLHGPAALLAGLGVMAGAVCGGALLTLISVGLVNALVWYGRLHYRLLKPAIDPIPTQRPEVAQP